MLSDAANLPSDNILYTYPVGDDVVVVCTLAPVVVHNYDCTCTLHSNMNVINMEMWGKLECVGSGESMLCGAMHIFYNG